MVELPLHPTTKLTTLKATARQLIIASGYTISLRRRFA
jgi:hypothetical protein